MGNYKSYGGIYIMKDIRKYKYSIAAMFSLLLLVLSGGCSKDEGGTSVPEKQFRSIEITINSKSNANPYTRAVDDEIVSEGPDEEYERHIDQYWLVIEKKVGDDSYQVDRIVTKDDTEYEDPNNNDDDSKTSLDVEVEIGETYRFSALANLSGLDDSQSLINELEGLETSHGDFSTFLSRAVRVKGMSEYHDNGGSYIPMTSYTYEQKIEEGTTALNEPIQLIRMIGKVTLEVRNLTESPITLRSLKMGQFRTSGEIYLFPYDLATGNTTKNLLANDMKDDYRPKFPTEGTTITPAFTDVTLFSDENANQNIPVYKEDDTSTHKFFTTYLNETTKSDNSDLVITTIIPNRSEAPVSSGFSFVRRNDWLQLPIQITDVTTTVTIDQQHMPIGGLPYSLTIPEVAFPVVDYKTDHAGKIKFDVALTKVSSMTNPTLKMYDGTITGQEKFCSAVLSKNNENGKPLLINLPNANDYFPTDRVSFVLTPKDNKSFTFEVTLQELASESNAVIDLSLVIVDGKKSMTIPYVINITLNTNKGGN